MGSIKFLFLFFELYLMSRISLSVYIYSLCVNSFVPFCWSSIFHLEKSLKYGHLGKVNRHNINNVSNLFFERQFIDVPLKKLNLLNKNNNMQLREKYCVSR